MDKIAKFFRDYSFARFFVPVGVLLFELMSTIADFME